MKFHKMRQIFGQGIVKFGLAMGLFYIMFASSCVPQKKFVYFNDLKEREDYPANVEIKAPLPYTDPVIQPNDILSISVQTLEPSPGNAPIAPTQGANETPLSGYLVDKDGYVEIAQVGFVKVGGLTTTEARELVRQKIKVGYNNPVIKLRIINFDVMVLGDVGRPGMVNIPSEKASILDVIALAGDLKNSAQRKNVLLARTEGDVTKFVRFDLTSSDIYKSPYFYVRQRDRIYVEQNRFTRQSSDNTLLRYIGYTSGLVGVMTLMIALNVIKIY